MAFSNNMTNLINKIEQRLGTKALTLPDHLKKSEWPEKVIIPMTIVTWSRYFPNKMRYHIDASHKMKNGWYLLDEDMFGDDVKILGVQNIDWGTFNNSTIGSQYGNIDPYACGMGLDTAIDVAIAANISSMYNTNIYPIFEPPNKFRLETAYGRSISVNNYDVNVLVEHSPNLLTISPTQMETFENLATCDVATYLYNELKYFDAVETAYANSNIRLDDLKEQADRRTEVMNYINESYVSAANRNQPYILCI